MNKTVSIRSTSQKYPIKPSTLPSKKKLEGFDVNGTSLSKT